MVLWKDQQNWYTRLNKKRKEYKFSTSAKDVIDAVAKTLKDNYNIMNNFMPLNMKT